MPLSATALSWGATVVAGLCLATITHAAPNHADPLDPQARVPPARHESVLQRHRGVSADVPVGDWRAANDTVTRIGGWRTYLRQAAQPDAPASAPAGTAPRP
jgi:hypothetical protein